MHKFVITGASLALLICSVFLASAPPTQARRNQTNCADGLQPGGARYRICLPTGSPAGAWNGDLVLYAHGYVPAENSLSLPGEASSMSGPLLEQGYAFGITSYRANGLAVLPAQEDLLELVDLFTQQHGAPKRIFLIGASEGGLITTLAVENFPDVFAGGVAMCGPIGSFRDQINYFGDFRVVFDALFPGRIPPGAVNIPPQVRANWSEIYHTQVIPALTDPANRQKVLELFAVTGAPFDPNSPYTIESTVRGVLGYNIFATGDASEKLGGQPFDNHDRHYTGSSDDERLNQAVERFTPSPDVIEAMRAYETTGKLQVPLVTIHTTGDEIVPGWHQPRYAEKVEQAGASALLKSITIERYGHCDFRGEEILGAFQQMVAMVDESLVIAIEALPTATPAMVQPSATPYLSPTVDKPVDNRPPVEQPDAPRGFFQRFWDWLTGLI